MTKASKKRTALTVRAEFQRVRGGFRHSCALFAVEGKLRPTDELDAVGAATRFGLTVSKKVGNAVVRNRVKRRLRAALVAVRAEAPPEADIVIIARTAMLDAPFETVLDELRRALRRAATMRRAPNRGTPA